MKKMIAMILALACVFSFAACASKKTDDTIGAESPSTSEQQTQTPSEDAAAEEQPSEDAVATMPDDDMIDDEFGVDGSAAQEPEGGESAAEGGTEKEESKQAALELLNKVWSSYTEDEKFPAAGGDYDNSVDDAAGAVNIANAENLSYLFTFPASDAVKLDGAASLMHMMNGNTFTCGAFHAANADDVSAIVEDIHSEISGKHWMCGFPDKMFIATSGNLIVSVYGDEELVNTFRDKLLAVDSSFTAAYDEAIDA